MKDLGTFSCSDALLNDAWAISRRTLKLCMQGFYEDGVKRDGMLIMVDDDRMPLEKGETPEMRMVRFRTLGCYPLTAAIDSDATTMEEIIAETFNTVSSERQGRLIDSDQPGSMEKKKQEGYF